VGGLLTDIYDQKPIACGRRTKTEVDSFAKERDLADQSSNPLPKPLPLLMLIRPAPRAFEFASKQMVAASLLDHRIAPRDHSPNAFLVDYDRCISTYNDPALLNWFTKQAFLCRPFSFARAIQDTALP